MRGDNVEDRPDPVSGAGAAEPAVEDNGPWFGVFVFVIVVLFAAAGAAVVHSLMVTFG